MFLRVAGWSPANGIAFVVLVVIAAAAAAPRTNAGATLALESHCE